MSIGTPPASVASVTSTGSSLAGTAAGRSSSGAGSAAVVVKAVDKWYEYLNCGKTIP